MHSYCEGLTEKEAKWVIAMSLDQLSVKEIAEREKVLVSAVKQWRSGALKKLRETIVNHN
ncbi:sigma factor-like helix-turn-helix DNA-binding protein [Neobacillus sp. 179-J 1A1 HS]|uniref:sigma factor-like helix-turn-helix DNA-binding protein n=1 Tax=Neobacillus driksii TaxID=3035913 RepID=UPI0035BBE37F